MTIQPDSSTPPAVTKPVFQQARGVSYLYMAAAFVIVVAGMRAAESIMNPLLLAIFLSVVSAPAYFGLLNRKVSEWLALLTVIGVLGLVLFSVVFVVTKSIAGFMAEQEHYQERLREEKVKLTHRVEGWMPAWAKRQDDRKQQESGAQDEVDSVDGDSGQSDSGEAAIPQEGAGLPGAPDIVADDAATRVGSEGDPNSTREVDGTGGLIAGQPDMEANEGVESDDSQFPSSVFHVSGQKNIPLAGSDWLNLPSQRPMPSNEQGWQEYMSEQFNPGNAISLAASVAGSVGQLLSNAFLILLMVIFILLEAGSFNRKMKLVFVSTGEAASRADEIVKSLQHYIVIKTWISLATGILVALWLNFFGVSHASLWGLLVFLFNFIPNVWSILAAIPAVLVAWLELGMQPAFACAIGFVLVNGVIGNFVEPRVMGKGLGLSALVVFCSMLFWGWVLGPVGMLLSVPLTMTARIVMDGFEDTKWIATLLGNVE